MKMHCYFLLNIKHGASRIWGPKYNCEAPGEGPLRGRGKGASLRSRGASNSLAPALHGPSLATPSPNLGKTTASIGRVVEFSYHLVPMMPTYSADFGTPSVQISRYFELRYIIAGRFPTAHITSPARRDGWPMRVVRTVDHTASRAAMQSGRRIISSSSG